MKGISRYMFEARNKKILSRLNFEELYDKYATDMIRVAYIYVNDLQLAEDICHDTFIKLIKKPNTLIEGKEKSWLLKVTVNACRDYLRSSWHKHTIVDDEMMSNISYEEDYSNINNSDILQIINKLSPKLKEIILLYYYQELSISEISEMLKISQGTISSRLARARNKIESLMEKRNE